MEISGDDIARVVLDQFEKLPKKRKPIVRTHGVREWVPLSGFVIQNGNELRCIALGTGMKCLPHNRLAFAKGTVLHDWHAETVAIRALNRYLLDECLQNLSISEQNSSSCLRRREGSEVTESHFQPFALKESLKLHMYCSEAPCGDASMELTMAAQDDSTPWELPLESGDAESAGLTGRGYFSKLGIVRRKPSRPDAPETLSKSCSDKLAMHQCTSLLSSITSLLFSPENMYITSLTVPDSQYSETGCRRAFQGDGRMASLSGHKWDGGYSFKPFDIKTTSIEFGYSRRITESNIEFVPCNITAVWTPKGEESLIGGVLQGRKQTDARGASMLCRKRMWELTEQLAARESFASESIVMKSIARSLIVASYSEVKECELLRGKRDVKDHVMREVLQGWTSNTGDTLSYDYSLAPNARKNQEN